MRLENAEVRIFRTVVESGGFRRAAEVLNLTQSAVSQSVKQLENKLDVELIQRGPPVTVTDAGRRLLKYAHDAHREEQSVLEDIERIREGEEELLSLAMDSLINRLYAPELFPQFCRRWPRVKLKVAEMPSRSIIYSVLSGQFELGLGPFQTRMETFETVPLFEEKRVLVVSPNCPLFDDIRRDPQNALKRLPMIVSSLDEPQQRPASSKLRDRFSTVWEISSLNLRLSLLGRGLGTGYISETALTQLPQCRDLISLEELSGGSIYRQVGIYYKKGRDLSHTARDIVELCRGYRF
jgi:DNA-binding transcriptional LysR family regulator